ncbi:hypothetical protein N0V90_012331 [Kalmusia sp. IMI 367209]|nr:hypothetical protein N0V90_012331 [Kalmusia sp. IMI 367209]
MLNTLCLVHLFSSVALAATVPANALFERSLDGLTKRATCTPASAGSASTDDVPAIEAAFKSCGSGGIIVIPAGKTYMVRSTLDLTGCSNCDFQIEGTLKASDDTTFWNGVNAIISVSGITGAKIRSVTGTGVVDGNGQASYDKFASDSSYKRPKLLNIAGKSTNIAVSNLRFKNPPSFFITNNGDSSHVSYESLSLSAESKSSNPAKNTDGIDVGPATYTTLKNITISNQDDCVAFKPGANYVTIDTIHCKGSHGLSVGSLGGSAGKTDTVQNVYVTNAIMEGATKAVGIKVYPGGSDHGTAVVKNVTYDGVTVTSSDYAAQIQSCYNEDASYCSSNPSTAQISDVYFKNFKGTTSSKYSPTIANINCPAGGTCNVYFSGWSVKAASGTAKYLCANIDNSNPGITCSSGASG